MIGEQGTMTTSPPSPCGPYPSTPLISAHLGSTHPNATI
jgi:hypothetical protein